MERDELADRIQLLELIHRTACGDQTNLILHRCRIRELPPEIGCLGLLQKLDLSYNRLRTLPPEIGQLTKLRKLDLSHNQLTILPPEIGQLTNLESLDLRANQLTELPPEIGQLTRLRELDLWRNGLKLLPPTIESLTQLQRLHLWDNHLTALPPEIGQLSGLQELPLSKNQLMALPAAIGRLTELRTLHLWDNRLEALPAEIGRLNRLRRLDLRNNRLKELPHEIQELTQLRYLDLRGNRLDMSPEIVAQVHEPAAIIHTYFDLLIGETLPLNEVKMVLVGQERVGKTSLVNRLLDDVFDPEQSETGGIDIRRWQLAPPTSDGETQIRINVWDFGGQEIMHATHQFFLTHRTLYLLVLNACHSEIKNRVEYWLRIIRSLAGDSPVILIGNKTDQQPLNIERDGLREKHPSIKAMVETSCKTGAGIDRLEAVIAQQILALPYVFDELPARWFDVKGRLEQMEDDYVPHADYVQMCRDAEILEESRQRVLLGFLHQLGIVLHFPDPRLETTNILSPEWVTRGVYRILNSPLCLKSGGILTWTMLERILYDEPYREKRIFIVDMMHRFELCYELPDRPHTYLIPDLLPTQALDTGPWEGALRFEVHYPVLPQSILTRLIVKMHRHTKKDPSGARIAWRTGVLLARQENEALVEADRSGNRIRIAVRGPTRGRRELLTRIREHLESIHATFPDLNPVERIPVPGHPDASPVDYRWLRALEREGIADFTPDGMTEKISVDQLLRGIEPGSVRRRPDLERTPIARNLIYKSYIGRIGDVSIPSQERSNKMDSVSAAVVAGLASGAAEGIAAQTYQTLTAAIKRKKGTNSELAETVEELERRPESSQLRGELENQVQAANADQDPELLALAERLIAVLKETQAGQQALSKYTIELEDSQVGVIGNHAHVEGGMHFGDSGDTFNMSGDFRGAFVNVKSRLENVTQTISTLPDADPSTKAELERLIQELGETLQQAPPDKAEEAEAVAQSAEALVEAATEEKPNRTMVEITGDGLKKAAQNLATVMPTVLTIATQIVETVSKLVAQR